MINIECPNYLEVLFFKDSRKFGPCTSPPFPALRQRPKLLLRIQEATVRRQRWRRYRSTGLARSHQYWEIWMMCNFPILSLDIEHLQARKEPGWFSPHIQFRVGGDPKLERWEREKGKKLVENQEASCPSTNSLPHCRGKGHVFFKMLVFLWWWIKSHNFCPVELLFKCCIIFTYYNSILKKYYIYHIRFRKEKI